MFRILGIYNFACTPNKSSITTLATKQYIHVSYFKLDIVQKMSRFYRPRSEKVLRNYSIIISPFWLRPLHSALLCCLAVQLFAVHTCADNVPIQSFLFWKVLSFSCCIKFWAVSVILQGDFINCLDEFLSQFFGLPSCSTKLYLQHSFWMPPNWNSQPWARV